VQHCVTAHPADAIPGPIVHQPLSGGWQAELDLRFAADGQRTLIARQYHRGPLVVQRPFYPEGKVCHVYIIHPPGGVVGGDTLSITATVDSGAHALITTPAATKFYRSLALPATLTQALYIEEDGCLEWLPQENIVFTGANASLTTHIDLAANSRFIGWEILCLGRPASNELFNTGQCVTRLELWRQAKPLLLERLPVNGSDALLHASWGMRDQPVLGTLLATPADVDLLARVRDKLVPDERFLIAISLIENVLVCRYLGQQAEEAKQCFSAIWAVVRPDIVGCRACPPRIWRT
jgi:urease accessory protein